MKRFLFYLIKIFILTYICFNSFSCKFISSYIEITNAYYNVNKGNYQDALITYLKIKNKEIFTPWIEYNIGTIYQELGENASALEVYNSIKLEYDNELLYSINFNKGVAYYGNGDYKNARESFLRALNYKSDDYDTKKNLELSISKLKSFVADYYKYEKSDEEISNEIKKDNSFDNSIGKEEESDNIDKNGSKDTNQDRESLDDSQEKNKQNMDNEILEFAKYKEEQTWFTNQKSEKKIESLEKDW